MSKYQDYLFSLEWAKIRERILNRDKICKICKTNYSQVVHHLTYANIFHESDYQLIGVCWNCHVNVHKNNHLFSRLFRFLYKF